MTRPRWPAPLVAYGGGNGAAVVIVSALASNTVNDWTARGLPFTLSGRSPAFKSVTLWPSSPIARKSTRMGDPPVPACVRTTAGVSAAIATAAHDARRARRVHGRDTRAVATVNTAA